jgi:carbamoyltransferase
LRANTNDGSWVLKRFKHLTGCPMLVKGSFNVRGEPIICTPDDVFPCSCA